jgi:dihydrofolate reductase
MIVTIIAALAEGNRAIGRRGSLPWRLPADMTMFRETTMGHVVIMGRVTFESLPGSLEGRRLIVLTRSPGSIPGVETAHSLPNALEIAVADPGETEIFIAGGGEVYEEALALDVVDRMRLTLVDVQVEADTFFPEFERSQWIELRNEPHQADAKNPHAYTFLTLQRRDEPI